MRCAFGFVVVVTLCMGTLAQPKPPAPRSTSPARLLQQYAVRDMSFAEWKVILAEGNDSERQRVWSVIKGQTILVVARVISVVHDVPNKGDYELQLACTPADIEENRADVTLIMKSDFDVERVPHNGDTVPVGGVATRFSSHPFMMQLEDGLLFKMPDKPPDR